MLDWLLIGGGVHGTALAFHLIHRRRVPASRLRILDPHGSLMARWDRFTANTGMIYLRSPGVHHLNDDPFSLRTFALTQAGQPLADFIPLHQRPALALFRAHSQQIIDRHRLDTLRLCGAALALHRTRDGWRVETTHGLLEAANVVLAIGAGDAPRWSDWAVRLRDRGAAVHHIFDVGFALESLPDAGRVLVIGGGISAAQVAVTLAARSPGRVSLLARHAPRIAHFDSDPCWTTRQCLARFAAEPDVSARRRMINAARQPGSMPPDVHQSLMAAIDAGRLRFDRAAVESVDWDGATITLHTAESSYTAERLLLATGFEARRPGGAWLDAAIRAYDLPLAPDGYPLVDASLRWMHGLFVMGPLAELEVGPTSRNIIGARLAAARIGRCV